MIYYAMANNKGTVKFPALSEIALEERLNRAYWNWKGMQSKLLDDSEKDYAAYLAKEWAGFTRAKITVEPIAI